MCDGVTQGRAARRNCRCFSRDVIAMSAAVALSHDMFDATLFLGVCDKIVPGLLIATLVFGHLPAVFIPAGPMTSGIGNEESEGQAVAPRAKPRARNCSKSRRSRTTVRRTFYGTANSNQMLMEIMGLHLPGTTFANPNTPLRDAITAKTQRAAAIRNMGNEYIPVGHVIDERAIVNGVVGLNATGGSTNHLLHLIAMAHAAGIELRLEDFHDLSSVVPPPARIYPNGTADVNHFDAAGGMGFLIGQLLDAGLLHADVQAVAGKGLDAYRVSARTRPQAAWNSECRCPRKAPTSACCAQRQIRFAATADCACSAATSARPRSRYRPSRPIA